MFKKKSEEVRPKKDKNKNPVVGLIIKYTIAWILLSVLLTDLIGRNYYHKKADELSVVLSETVQYYLSDLKEDLKTGSLYDKKISNKAQYVLQLICSSLADRFYTSYKVDPEDVVVETSGELGNYETYNDNKVYLVPRGELKIYTSDDEVDTEDFVYTCSKKYLDEVIKAIEEIKINRTGWEPAFGVNVYHKILLHDVPMTDEDEPNFRISLVEGYISDTEFRPVKVKIEYNTTEGTKEEIIECIEPRDITGYQYITEFPDNAILIPEDGAYWKNEDDTELATRYIDISGLKVIVPAFPAESLYWDGNHTYGVQVIDDGFMFLGRQHSYPFNFLKGDMTFSYAEYLRDKNGEKVFFEILCYANGGLKYYNSEFFKYMEFYYIALFAVFAVLAIFSYRRQYSLKAKNRFHKTLINAMANDLKVPLSDMQASCEGLVENINDDEKKEFYARQIIDEIHTVNKLVNKNLNMSPDKQDAETGEDQIYLMDIFGKAEAKYQEELSGKKIIVKKKGDTFLTGKEDVFSLAFDKLLEELVRKAQDEQSIMVTGRNRSFMIVCKTDSALEPSMAYDVFSERGWRIKQKYNMKTKMLIYKVMKKIL